MALLPSEHCLHGRAGLLPGTMEGELSTISFWLSYHILKKAGECKLIMKLGKAAVQTCISIFFINLGVSELPLSSLKILIKFLFEAY